MSKVQKVLKYLINPRLFYVRFASKKLNKVAHNLSDEDLLTRIFKIKFGYDLDLSNPKTFNEKLQWLKLNNRNPLFTEMVDKYAAKKYVANIVGDEYVVPQLGCWKHFDDIDFSSLPDKFVLKTTHGCGGMLICKDKNKINFAKAKVMFEENLKDNYYIHAREWPYKNVPPQIIAEKFLDDGKNKVLPVYKIFCFNGEPYLIQVIQNDKQPNESIDYFDLNWNKLKLRQNYPNSKNPLEKPIKLEEMLAIARKLTKGIEFVRCDLYIVDGKIYFSEFTFFSDAGFEPFKPNKWDYILGDLLILSSKKTN